ncbi:MAG: hypothetical protein V4693_21705 [Pseudomonadota bacterium]
MNIYLKTLLAGAFALAVSQSASASTQVRIGIHAGPPVQYYPHHAQPVYGYAPGYYVAPRSYGYVEPSYRGRHDWRARRAAELRRQEWLRREEWRREQWRREQWRRNHWRDDHRRGDGHWDGRR